MQATPLMPDDVQAALAYAAALARDEELLPLRYTVDPHEREMTELLATRYWLFSEAPQPDNLQT